MGSHVTSLIYYPVVNIVLCDQNVSSNNKCIKSITRTETFPFAKVVSKKLCTRYLRPGGTSPLKEVSLIVGLYIFTIRPERDIRDALCLGNAMSLAR